MEIVRVEDEYKFIQRKDQEIQPRNVAVRMSDILHALEETIPSRIDAHEFLEMLTKKAYIDNGI